MWAAASCGTALVTVVTVVTIVTIGTVTVCRRKVVADALVKRVAPDHLEGVHYILFHETGGNG